jgi:hypothetical protein
MGFIVSYLRAGNKYNEEMRIEEGTRIKMLIPGLMPKIL